MTDSERLRQQAAILMASTQLMEAMLVYSSRATAALDGADAAVQAKDYERAGDHMAAVTCLFGSATTVLRDLATLQAQLIELQGAQEPTQTVAADVPKNLS